MRLLLVLPQKCSLSSMTTMVGFVGVQEDDKAADFQARFLEPSLDEEDNESLEVDVELSSESDEFEECFLDLRAAFPFAFFSFFCFSFLFLCLAAVFRALRPGSSQSSTVHQISEASSSPMDACISRVRCPGRHSSSSSSRKAFRYLSKAFASFRVQPVAPVLFRIVFAFFGDRSLYLGFSGTGSVAFVFLTSVRRQESRGRLRLGRADGRWASAKAAADCSAVRSNDCTSSTHVSIIPKSRASR